MIRHDLEGVKMGGCFTGKVALVTGGSSGIGRASALAFAREGAKIVVADLNEEGGMETTQIIKQAGGDSIFMKTDVTMARDVERLVNKTVETFGRLDCAHNNAGISGPVLPLAEHSEEQWDQIINANLKSVWLCMKYEILYMSNHGGGSIVNTSSTTGLRGAPMTPVYTSSKHGVTGLTKSGAIGYSSIGIRINEVCPGPTFTPLLVNGPFKGDVKTAKEKLRDGLLNNPEDVAEAVLYLCSDAARHINGHSLVIDMGATVEHLVLYRR
jgi:NAD(P)-dependent dehydrogenase (short-subunit alcohol dehydrogenase family)